MEENAEAWELWRHVRTQWRAAGFGVVGLDYPAVRKEARQHFDMEISPGLMRKLQALERVELEKIHDTGASDSQGSPKADQGSGGRAQAPR